RGAARRDRGWVAPGAERQARGGDRSRLGRALRQHAILCTVIGFQTFARVVQEVRGDLTAAQQRDPAARTVSRAEILLTYGGVHALLAHRVSHALHEARVPL